MQRKYQDYEAKPLTGDMKGSKAAAELEYRLCQELVFGINRTEIPSTNFLAGKEFRNVYENIPVVLRADFGFFLFSITY